MKKDQELLDAARIGNFTLIEKLLAARSRSSTIVASLGIKVGANVNCQDHSGYTPLHHAALNGHKLVVQYILQHAASVNINDVKGNFPLHLAAWSGNHEIVRTLLTHGPSIAKVNEKNGDNETALHCASQHGHTDTVEVLLDNGADPSVRNVHHESPLDLASQYGRLDVVRLLLYYQPSLLSRFPECFSPLHLASRNGHKEVAELLLAHGADINQSGENGSALHEAALFGKLEVVKLLLSRGANPHTLDPQSRSPLELMKQLNTQTSREIAQLILSRMQEGEDYEPLNPVANLALTSLCLRRFLNEPTTPDSSHTHTDMMRGLWGKGGFTLRRSASARSSKSLPRLPSTRSRSPGSSLASPDLNPPTLQQHHPSSNMFPVSPMNRRSVALRRSSSSLPDANSSLLSLPTIPTIQPLKRSDATKPFTREPLKSEDDSVFLPSNSLGSRRRRSNKSRRARARSMDWHSPSAYHVMSNRDPPTDVDGIVFNVPSSLSRSFSNSKEKIASSGSTSMSPVNRPKKPARTKLSTLCSPPPIPPKPCSMIQASKVRPPSPENPPPDDESDSAEEDCVEEQEIEVFVAPSSCENGSGCEKSLKDTPHVHIGAESENLKPELTASHDLHSNTPSRGDIVNTLTAVSGTSTPMRPPSPAISPPSPHSAMIEISQTLQDALHSEDGVDGIVACDNLKSPCLNDPIATESNHSSNVIVMTCSAAKQSEISTTSSTASVMHVASSHSRSEDVNSQDKTGNLLKNKNRLNGTQQCLPRNTKSVQENLVALKPDNENTRNNDHAPYPMQSSSDHIIKVTKESIAHNNHEGLVEQMDKLKPITAIKPEPKPRIKPKPRISSTTSSISAGEEVASDRLGPVKTDTNHTEDAVSFILCYTGGAKVKHARIRSTRSTESGSGSTSTEPDPIAQVQSEDSNSLFIEDLGGISINSRTHNEVQVQYDSSWGIPTESKSRISTSLEKEDLPPIDSSSIGSWDDALSDRTEDLEIPDAVRKFRGLIRGASYRSRSKSRYPTVARDISPYEYDRYGDSSDGYGEDILENFPGVNPVLLGDNIALVDSMTRETTPKRSEADKSVAERTAIRYSSELFSRQQKIPSSRRSDGRDSPMSSSSAEEYDRVTQTAQCKISHSTTSGSDGETSKEIRTNSFYDNNSAQHSSNPDLSSLKISDTESIGRLPDLETIVDAVTAVRSRSTRGSKSDSTSSASSTLAKPPTLDPVSSVPKDEVTVADDKDEWAEIANIMSSLGGGLNKGGGVYAKEFEKTFWQIMTGSDLPQQISTWLTDLGLSQYEKVLTGNGFDDVDFLADDILEEQDLIDMDITESSHRRRILESAKNLPKLHSLPQADSPLAPCSVGDWLSSLHLPEYEAVFVKKGYHSMAQVRTMAEFEIKPLVVNRGHLKRLMASLRSADQQKSPSHRRSSRKSSTSQTKSSPPLSRSPLLETVNFFKDYNTIVNSRATTTSSNTIGTDTVSSTSSSSFSNICSDPHHSTGNRVPRNGQIPASIPETTPSNTDSGSRNHNCRKESRGDNDHSHDTGREGDRLTSESSSRRSRSYRHQSSQDSDSRKPRSRSGSSTRLNNSELSVFVDNVKVKNNKTSRSDSQKSKNHRSKHRRSSSSSRRRGSEQKENLRTMSVRVTDIPNTERATSLASGGALNLRPPNETTREVSVSSWRHTADVLINSCCNYQACYLGSMLIPELKGVASTMEACSKMKKSTDALKKIPTITLSINYKGVKFIDFKSKHEIAEHEIQNISFASQDSEDRATFAYITHDVKTGHHYCHVFRVTTMDMAYEIILTLGQAFEVVYQLILKDQEMKGNDLT